MYNFAILLQENKKGCKNNQIVSITNHSFQHPVKIFLNHLRRVLKRLCHNKLAVKKNHLRKNDFTS